MFGVGWSGSPAGGLGIVQVNSGTLNLAQWNDASSISPLGQLDIRGGKVLITGDHTSSVANFVAGGQLTGFGGVGTVNYSFDTNNNQTVVTAARQPGAGGPYPANNWPTNINPNKVVHYYVTDGTLSAPNANWTATLGLKNDGDQATVDVTVKGLLGKQATAANINIWDQEWQFWNTEGLIDILVQVYGDGNVLRSVTDPYQGRRFRFLTGTLPVDSFSEVYGGTFATNAFNSEWNWILFTITNNLQTNLLGDRYIGSIKTNGFGGTNYGGINGGTIRIQGPDNNANGLIIHAVAFGQHGAFGTAPDINQFALASGACPPVVDVNLAGIDFNGGVTNHLQVINDPATAQGVVFVNNAGPAGDQRKAVMVDTSSMFLNFGITSNYLGQPCNDNVNMKVCVDYYDDPAFANLGVVFGPYAYATDSQGSVATITPFPAPLQGTGKWIRQSWVMRSVNLYGVNTAPLTGGPQFISTGGQVAVSRFYIAALRTTGPLAGQDPLADCLSDPAVCNGVYGNYAELDLGAGITNGVDVGSSGGDQVMVVEQAGPASDKRLAVRGDTPGGYFINFQIVTNALGPTSQGNMHVAMLVTYYDDPAHVGIGFRPQVWKLQTVNGLVFNYMGGGQNMVLQGSDKWRDAYFEIGTISLDGVNQSGQALARFQTDGGAPIYISRIRYQVVRPCGATAGLNPFFNKVAVTAGPSADNLLRLSWPYQAPQAVLEGSAVLGGGWSPFSVAPVPAGDQNVVLFGPTNANSQFFRLTITPP